MNNNYFYNNSGVQYFEIFNEKTKVMFFDNFVNDDVPLYSKLGNVKEDSLVFENNTLGAITQLDYTSAYRVQGHYFNNGMGPIRGLTHKFNYDGIREFEIMAIDSIYIQKNIPDTIFISCVDRTEKPISYTVTNLPPFAKFVDNQNGTAMVTFLIDNNQELQKKYIFNINAQEDNGDTDDVNIDVFTNLPPKANAGVNFEIKLPVDSLILQGDASSGDGVLTYLWITTSSAIIENETTLSPTIFNINSIGEYIFSLIVTDEDGDVDTSNIIVTVMPEPILVDSVSVSQLSADIEENATIQLSANVIPSNADNKNVLWSSSNEDIATVNEDGLVTGLAEGVVNIIATSSDGNASASIEITVSKSSNKSIISDISNSEIICTILPNTISIINQSNFNQISIKIINELGQSYFSANSKKKELLIDFNEIRMSKGIYRLIIMYDNQIIKVKKFIYQ